MRFLYSTLRKNKTLGQYTEEVVVPCDPFNITRLYGYLPEKISVQPLLNYKRFRIRSCPVIYIRKKTRETLLPTFIPRLFFSVSVRVWLLVRWWSPDKVSSTFSSSKNIMNDIEVSGWHVYLVPMWHGNRTDF